MTAYRF